MQLHHLALSVLSLPDKIFDTLLVVNAGNVLHATNVCINMHAYMHMRALSLPVYHVYDRTVHASKTWNTRIPRVVKYINDASFRAPIVLRAHTGCRRYVINTRYQTAQASSDIPVR